MAYFFAVGAGFMFLELYFIKAFILLFHDPVISLAVVLASLLLSSGAGGYCSRWLSSAHLAKALCSLVVLCLLMLAAMDGLLSWLLRLPLMWAYLLVPVLTFPAGFMIGLPFTLGMQHLAKTPVDKAYAWAVNGCASVLASIGSAQLALIAGVPLIMACAGGAYAVAYLSIAKPGSP